jgi:hypothetical protein
MQSVLPAGVLRPEEGSISLEELPILGYYFHAPDVTYEKTGGGVPC